MSCIPANPDISGVGVRSAIYAQNLLCFAPVVAHLWDGKVTEDEIGGIQDQSIGMLAVAFAILISTIIQATSSQGQRISNFHAAVVLDLSWMNNTSTFIWFLLYAHQRSKDSEPIHATRSDWSHRILSSLRRNTEKDGKQRRTIHYLRDLVSRAPVLTMGSIHLSLMASIGIWLWSNPSNFGAQIPCNPSLTIVGGSVPFSSPVLRIFSLTMYSLLLVPGVNLIPGILFLLSLHILYNKSRNQHPHFWTRLQRVSGSVIHGLHLTLRWILKKPLRKRKHRVSPLDEESQSDGLSVSHNVHTSFLVVGLVCLAIINILFLADIELTLSRNEQSQSGGENEWGFGQVLSLLLLVVPLRDFITSIIRIREKLQEMKEEAVRTFKDSLRTAIFADSLGLHDFRNMIEQGVDPNTQLDGSKFATLLHFAVHKKDGDLVKCLLENGADLNIRGDKYETALWIASAAGNIDMVHILLETATGTEAGTGIEEATYRTAFQVASSNGCAKVSHLLFGDGRGIAWHDTVEREATHLAEGDENKIRFVLSCICKFVEYVEGFSFGYAFAKQSSWLVLHPQFDDDIRMAIPDVVELCFVNWEFDVRKAALEGLSIFASQSQFGDDVRVAIPAVVQGLSKPDYGILLAALEGLPIFASDSRFDDDFRVSIPAVVKDLDSDFYDRATAVKGLSIFASYSRFDDVIRVSIPAVVECLASPDSDIRKAALEGLSIFASDSRFNDDIRVCIPAVVKYLDSDFYDRATAVKGLSIFASRSQFGDDIRVAIPAVVKCLSNPNYDVREAALEGLPIIASQSRFDDDIRVCIPAVVKYLDSDSDSRRAIVKGLSIFASHPQFGDDIRVAIPAVVECLSNPNYGVREAALEGLSIFASDSQFYDDIRVSIPAVVKYLDSDSDVREIAVKGLSIFASRSQFGHDIRVAIPFIVECLSNPNYGVREAALEGLSIFASDSQFYDDIRVVIPTIVECLGDSNRFICEAAVKGLSIFASDSRFDDDIRVSIPVVVKYLDSGSYHHATAVKGLSVFASHPRFSDDIRVAIPAVIECLADSYSDVREAAVKGLSIFASHSQFGDDIRVAIPAVFKCLADRESGVRSAALEGLSIFASDSQFGDDIRVAVPAVVKFLANSDSDVCKAALAGLTIIVSHPSFHDDIRIAIPIFTENLTNSDAHIRRTGGDILSTLAIYPPFFNEMRFLIPFMREWLRGRSDIDDNIIVQFLLKTIQHV